MAAAPNNGANNGDSSEPSSRAPVAFPDFRLFDSAQDILDHNKRLIKEIKANHDAQTPEALARNCLLIRELNTNISAVMGAYNSIGDSFQAYMDTQQQLEQQAMLEQQQQQMDQHMERMERQQQVEQLMQQQQMEQQQAGQEQEVPTDEANASAHRADDQETPSSRQGMEEDGGGEEEGEEQGGEAAVPQMPPA